MNEIKEEKMKLFILLLLIPLLFCCSTTGFDIYYKDTKTSYLDVIHYCSSPLEIKVHGNEETTYASMKLEFIRKNNLNYWFVTANFIDGKFKLLKPNKIKLYIGESSYIIQNLPELVNKEKMIMYNKEKRTITFFLNEKFFREIIFAKRVLMRIFTDEGEYNAFFSNQEIENIGLFYRYIENNVLDNKITIII